MNGIMIGFPFSARNARLSNEEAKEICVRLVDGESPQELAYEYDVPVSTIYKIKSGDVYGAATVNVRSGYQNMDCIGDKYANSIMKILNDRDINGF